MKAAIIQSNYVPWKGYFDFIHDADIFIFLDVVEYSKGSWRNRNKIKTAAGPKWLTVPVPKKGLNKSLISEVPLLDKNWQDDHFRKLENSYKTAPHWNRYLPLLEELYKNSSWTMLSEMNQEIIKCLSAELGISDTKFYDSSELDVEEVVEPNFRLIKMLKNIGVDTYISGPSAKDYINLEKWHEADISVIWKDYNYPEYGQLYPPFVHEVSVLDLLLMAGPEAGDYIWGKFGNKDALV